MTVAVTVVLLAWRFGIFAVFADAEHMKATLLEMGTLGYVAYLGVFALLQPVGVPGMALTIGASYVWPKPIAFALSLIGSLLASTTGFLFARFVARDWVAASLPPRFRGYDERIAKNGFATAFVLRLIFVMNPFLHGLFGISKIRYRSYILGSALGYIPPLIICVWASAWAIEVLKTSEPRQYLPIVLGVVVLGVAIRLVFWWRKRARGAGREDATHAATPSSDSVPPASSPS